MSQNDSDGNNMILGDDEILERVSKFCYLGDM